MILNKAEFLSQKDIDIILGIAKEDIERGIRDDPDAAPICDEAWWADAELVPPRKMPVSMRLDPDILEFFKSQGPGYQTRINAVLRKYMESVRKAG